MIFFSFIIFSKRNFQKRKETRKLIKYTKKYSLVEISLQKNFFNKMKIFPKFAERKKGKKVKKKVKKREKNTKTLDKKSNFPLGFPRKREKY